MAAMETPEEKALRLKDSGNEALKICKYSEVSGQCEVFESHARLYGRERFEGKPGCEAVFGGLAQGRGSMGCKC